MLSVELDTTQLTSDYNI